ncbi:MAG: hypothetical protein ACR2P1_11130 [Pseudomonadales bacterium]
MSEQHPNVALLMGIDPRNAAASKNAFAEDFVWHYFNPRLPDIEGEYVGIAGLQDFFAKIAGTTKGTFEANPFP